MSGEASAAWSRVAAFASAMDSSLDKWLGDTYRLGLTEYRALTHLSHAPEKELRITTLAQRVGLTSTSTTRLVSRLEAKGHARRDVCEDDGRGVYAVIDEPGEELLREVRGAYENRVRELLGNPAKYFPQIDPDVVASALGEVSAVIKS
ncbi:MarR family transcriptional regulator [Gordonia sinesedis]